MVGVLASSCGGFYLLLLFLHLLLLLLFLLLLPFLLPSGLLVRGREGGRRSCSIHFFLDSEPPPPPPPPHWGLTPWSPWGGGSGEGGGLRGGGHPCQKSKKLSVVASFWRDVSFFSPLSLSKVIRHLSPPTPISVLFLN